MNVLIVTSWYPNDKSQIAGVFIKEQAKALLKVELNPIVLFPYDGSIDKKQLKYNIEDGIPTYRANTDYMKNSFISKANSLIKAKKLIKKIVIKEDIDIIHSHVCYPSGFAVYFYSMSSKIPYVITEHMSTIYDFQKKFYNRFLFKKSYKNARRVITVSSFLMDELENMGFHFKGEIIPNVVDAADYEISKKSDKNSFNILFIGRMDDDEVKGIKYLIPAFANTVNRNREYNLKLTLVGDGAKRKEYEKLAKDCGVKNNCEFVGRVLKQSIPYYISNCDFLVLPSIKETFGSVLIEAMAGGKPVLATNCGGPNDIINDKVGILVEKENVNALEKGIDDMIHHYDEFDSNYIRNEVHNKYSYEAVGNKLKNLYLNILEK